MRINCPECGSIMNVPDEMAGKQGRCPGCKEVIDIPQESAETINEAASAAEPVDGEKRAPEPEIPFEPPATSVEQTASAACRKCGNALNAGVVFCPKCGTRTQGAPTAGARQRPQDNFRRPHFTPPAFSAANSGPPPGFDQLEVQGKIVIPPEYAPSFNPRGFCWPAFFFVFFWYFYKGMINKGLLILVASVIITFLTFSIGFLVVPIILGIIGYKDYARFYSTKQQFWW